MSSEHIEVPWREQLRNPEDQRLLKRLEQAGVHFEWRKHESSDRIEPQPADNAALREIDWAVTTNAVFTATYHGKELARTTDQGPGSINQAGGPRSHARSR